jgi:AcrR family transcriptional regulator
VVKENKKLNRILETARKLFWKHGLKRVSVEEICCEAGVSKMTFYKHFANKTELAKFILDIFFQDSMNEYRKIMESDLPFHERIKSAITFKMINTTGISQELINELYKSGDPEIMDFIQQWLNKSLSMIMDDFRSWQAKGEIRPDIKPEFILYMLNKVMAEMATDEHLTRLYADTAAMSREFITFLFYGLLPANRRE